MHQSKYKWIWSYFSKRPISTFFVVFTSIIEPFLYMIPLFISADIVDTLVNGGSWSEVSPSLQLLVILAAIQVIIFFTSSFLNEILAHRATTDITYDLFEVLQEKSLTYHDDKDVGEIMARATNDTRAVNMGLSPGIRLIIAWLVIWIVGMVVLGTIHIFLVYYSLIICFLFIIALIDYAKRITPLSTKVLEELAGISKITNDAMTGIRDIKTYTSENWFNRKFSKQVVKYALSKEKEGKIGAWFLPDLIVRFFALSVGGVGLWMAFQGSLGLGELVLLATTLSLVAGMSEEMSWVSFIIVGSGAAVTRLFEFMVAEDPDTSKDGTITYSGEIASIEFKDVTFRYRPDLPPALTNISFKVEENETVAIVGSPGSGKSSLTKLIQRLYSPQSGEIMLGTNNLKEYTNSSLRTQISTVEQEIFLFNDTIFENIRFGNPEASIEQVIAIAKIAQAHEFIQELKDKYETFIGEDGVRISGGQAQRIAIARALLINPSILIFDDGASALDALTEARIQRAISEILKTRTTIITTHRLAIIAKANKIIILDKGSIVGMGAHEELIRRNFHYRKLFEQHYELPELITTQKI
ncbi:MAG: ABC transporter ATP-binding protein [Candidatus Kariarchaeaceae archaeon]